MSITTIVEKSRRIEELQNVIWEIKIEGSLQKQYNIFKDYLKSIKKNQETFKLPVEKINIKHIQIEIIKSKTIMYLILENTDFNTAIINGFLTTQEDGKYSVKASGSEIYIYFSTNIGSPLNLKIDIENIGELKNLWIVLEKISHIIRTNTLLQIKKITRENVQKTTNYVYHSFVIDEIRYIEVVIENLQFNNRIELYKKCKQISELSGIKSTVIFEEEAVKFLYNCPGKEMNNFEVYFKI